MARQTEEEKAAQEELEPEHSFSIKKNAFKQQTVSGRFKLTVDTAEGPMFLQDLRPSVVRQKVNHYQDRNTPSERAALRFWTFVLSCFPSPVDPDPRTHEDKADELREFAKARKARLSNVIVDPYRIWEIIFGEACQIVPPPENKILVPREGGRYAEVTPAEQAAEREEAEAAKQDA